jgi:hypothetical protein
MLISEIAEPLNLKPQLINSPNTLLLNTYLNQVSSRKNDPCSFKIKDSTSLILIYCQLNI